jgi:hypothetical protein
LKQEAKRIKESKQLWYKRIQKPINEQIEKGDLDPEE